RLIDTPAGVLIKTQNSAFIEIKNFRPDSELDRRVLGALQLPADFNNRLQPALESRDEKQLESLAQVVLDKEQNNDALIRRFVANEVGDIVQGIRDGKIGRSELEAARNKLSKYHIHGRPVFDETLVLLEISKQATYAAARKQAEQLVLSQ